MSGVLFAKVVAAEGAFLQAKAGRGDRPGVKLGPGLFDDSSFLVRAGFGSGSEFGVRLSARFARDKLPTGSRVRAICVQRGGSGVGEVIAKTMASALFLSKSMRHSSARGCAPELSVRIRHRSFLLGGTRLCGGAGQRSTRGPLSCRRYAGRRRGPHYLCSRK